jgi:hypothetical protein
MSRALIRRGRPWKAVSLADGTITLTPLGLIVSDVSDRPDEDRPALGVLARIRLADEVEAALNGRAK